MSAPSDGARADARKARAEQAALPDVRESASLAELTSVIFGHVGPLTWTSRTEELVQVQLARTILASDWLAGVIADAKAEALREIGVRLDGHGLVAAIHDPLCPERVTHGSGDRPCHFSGAVTAYDVAESVKTYLRDEVQR